jgi:phage-related protein
MVYIPYNRGGSLGDMGLMLNPGYAIYYYQKPDGKVPVTMFLDDLSSKMQAKVAKEIALLRKNGPNLGAPYCKYLNDGIYELRCQTEGNTTRIFYFFVSGKKVILTNGFIKKTEKTPSNELTKAKRYREDYLSKHIREDKHDHLL